MPPDSLWPALLLLGALLMWWHAAMRALDQARNTARAFCRAQRWQLLDQTVALDRTRLARGPNGLCLWRRWRFEFSSDGSDRLSGGLVMRAGRLIEIWGDGPEQRVIETQSDRNRREG
ncbi:MAG: DUF3301 domain-containing protein [Wenzhouxiangellaceae bacterium]|nr:DUF3301 domain-containing protein [Wenzhouxiangellaceae bacterium]